jgi:hypothetical protein
MPAQAARCGELHGCRLGFVDDSPLEGDGFEPSVPRKMGCRFETAFRLCDRPHFAEKGSPSSRPGAEGLNPHSLSRCPRESHSCKSSPAPSRVLARTKPARLTEVAALHDRHKGFVRVTGWLGSEIAGTLTRWLKSHTAATAFPRSSSSMLSGSTCVSRSAIETSRISSPRRARRIL